MSFKEVRFDVYCKTCIHYDKSESEDPCWDCLNQGWNEDTHRPILYEPSSDEKSRPKHGIS